MKKIISTLSILLLAGCASLPTEIDIKSGPELVAPEQNELSYYTPTGPTPSASAQDIVSGFLAAGTGPQNDYAVARQFLTAEFAQRWNPESGVLVRAGVPVFKSSNDSLQNVEVGVTARVDEQGRYLDAEPGSKTSLRFQLVKESGEWRISSAPNLTVVTAPVFSVVFSAFPVYFLDTNLSRLVPDLRWFPTRASTGTKLVNALLAGPSDWLAQAVKTAIPQGTKMTIAAVSVEQGVAQVDLDTTALEATAIERRLMLTQLRSTLLQLPGVTNVSVSIDNTPQDIIPTQFQTSTLGGPVYLANSSGVFRANAGETMALAGTSGFAANKSIKRFAISGDADSIALATGDGVYAIQSSGLNLKTTKISDLKEVADMFFDDWGLLWLIPSDPAKDIVLVNNNFEQRVLGDGANGERVSYKISAEGARLAKLTKTEQVSQIQVNGVIRDSQGWPIRLIGEQVVNNVLGEAIALSWQQSSELRVLERTTSGLTAISDYSLTGPRKQLTMPPVAGIEITEGPSGLSTYLLTESGDIWVLTGTAWRELTTEVSAISTAG